MAPRRSLGGIGKLYSGDVLLGEVYYNIKQGQPPGKVACTLVFFGNDAELVAGPTRYRLFLEDGSYLFVTIPEARTVPSSPYTCVSVDGIYHTTPFSPR